jgi:hypothetical protein
MRFTIRDLLWVTVVVAVALALGLGWNNDRNRLIDEMDERNRFLHSAMESTERERQNWVEMTEAVERDHQNFKKMMKIIEGQTERSGNTPAPVINHDSRE